MAPLAIGLDQLPSLVPPLLILGGGAGEAWPAASSDESSALSPSSVWFRGFDSLPGESDAFLKRRRSLGSGSSCRGFVRGGGAPTPAWVARAVGGRISTDHAMEACAEVEIRVVGPRGWSRGARRSSASRLRCPFPRRFFRVGIAGTGRTSSGSTWSTGAGASDSSARSPPPSREHQAHQGRQRPGRRGATTALRRSHRVHPAVAGRATAGAATRRAAAAGRAASTAGRTAAATRTTARLTPAAARRAAASSDSASAASPPPAPASSCGATSMSSMAPSQAARTSTLLTTRRRRTEPRFSRRRPALGQRDRGSHIS